MKYEFASSIASGSKDALPFATNSYRLFSSNIRRPSAAMGRYRAAETEAGVVSDDSIKRLMESGVTYHLIEVADRRGHATGHLTL